MNGRTSSIQFLHFSSLSIRLNFIHIYYYIHIHLLYILAFVSHKHQSDNLHSSVSFLLFLKRSHTTSRTTLPSLYYLPQLTGKMFPYRRAPNALSSTSMVTITSSTPTVVNNVSPSETALRPSRFNSSSRFGSSTTDVPRHLRPQSLPFLRASTS